MIGSKTIRFGKWTIDYDPLPIPSGRIAKLIRELDFIAVHDDFDGAPTDSESGCTDRRCVRGGSVRDVLDQVNDLELADEPEWTLCSCRQIHEATEPCPNPSCDRNADREER